MALIDKTGISNGNTIDSSHVTRIIDALDGTSTATIIATGSFTGSFKGVVDASIATASFATYAATAGTASYVVTAQTASYVVTAQTASYVATASYVTTSATASYVQSSNVFGPHGANSVTSASYAKTASYVDGLTGFSEIVIGGTTISADQQNDTLTLVAGTNITLTPNASTDTITIAAAGGGGGNSFSTIAVSGQSDVVADSSTDTLTLVAGTNITLTTNASTDTITINAAGGGGGGSVSTTGTTLYSTSPAAGTTSTDNSIYLGGGATNQSAYAISLGKNAGPTVTANYALASVHVGAWAGKLPTATPSGSDGGNYDRTNTIAIGVSASSSPVRTVSNAIILGTNAVGIGTDWHGNTKSIYDLSYVGQSAETSTPGYVFPYTIDTDGLIAIGNQAGAGSNITGSGVIIIGDSAAKNLRSVLWDDANDYYSIEDYLQFYQQSPGNIVIGAHAGEGGGSNPDRFFYDRDSYPTKIRLEDEGNILIGAYAGYKKTTYGSNILIGYKAGYRDHYNDYEAIEETGQRIPISGHGIALGRYTLLSDEDQVLIGNNIKCEDTTGLGRSVSGVMSFGNGMYISGSDAVHRARAANIVNTLNPPDYYKPYGSPQDVDEEFARANWIRKTPIQEINVGIGMFPIPSFSLATYGQIQSSGTTMTSDARLKENIEEANYETCYNIVNSLPLKRYAWISGSYDTTQMPDRTKIGWIAQDVEQVFPKAITVSDFSGIPSYDESGSFNGVKLNDCKYLDKDQIYAAMYGTIKYLIAENNTLKSQVSASNADIAAIKTHLGL